MTGRLRSWIKSGGEFLVTASGLPGLALRRRRGRTLVLAYHNVVRAGDPVPGDRSLHLDFDTFRRQLDLLQATGTVERLDALSGAPEPDAPPRYVVTFDDAYRGSVLLAVPELRARGLPATIFVPPGLLGTPDFWWDAVPVSGWDDPAPLGELRGEDSRVREWAASRGHRLREIPPLQAACTVEELSAALPDDLVTLACHTWDHPNLARLTADEVGEQLRRSLEWLQASGLPSAPWISYPYGSTSEQVRMVTRASGLVGGLRVDGGWIPPDPADPFDLPRVNIPAGLSTRGFQILITGLRPAG